MPIDIERPAQSHKQPLRRGIHITEHKDYRVNPEPLVLQEADFLLEEFLSPTKLRALTGTDDLANIRELEMIVDTSDTSLGNFGVYLQKLVQLKLSNSVIPRISNSTADRYRSPMRVNYEPVLASTNVHRSSLSSTTEPPSPTLKGPKSSTKKSLKGLRNDPLPTLPRLPPRKT
ncbi:unnamed protein product [Rotaria sp. Silwood1]|nr:unnamed protein product [Rotaria sp. Silwood1]